MEDSIVFLKNLKDEIDLLHVHDKKRLELIDEYNEELYEILLLLNEPLSEEYELDQNLILDEYKEFKEDFNKNGYYTFKRFISNIDLIAEVRIKKIEMKTVVYAEVIKLYKGYTKSPFIMNTQEVWLPHNWFKKGDTCLVFLKYNDSGEYSAFGYGNKMSIVIENNEKFVICHHSGAEFWENTKVISTSSDGTKIRYEDVIRQIKNE